MIKVKITKAKEHFIGGAGDYRPDSDFDPQLLQKGIDKEIGDHGLPPSDAQEIAKDELTLDPAGYSKELKEGYDHKQFIEWLNAELPKEDDSNNKLLVEKKLSKYWRKRAARRALKAERQWPNSGDRKWALKQQLKSEEINQRVNKLFEKEIEKSEEMIGEVDSMMREIKKKRKKRMKITLDHPAVATAKRKNGKSLSVPTRPTYGGVAKGYRKKSKKMGGATLAPGESFGPAGGAAPMEEQKVKTNENN